jgi:hypothetical protein
MADGDRIERIGFTATHGLEHADKGPYFLWLNGKCNNALTKTPTARYRTETQVEGNPLGRYLGRPYP